MTSRIFVAICLSLCTAMASDAVAQELARVGGLPEAPSLERVRTLYAAAAYEDALAVMPAADGETVKTDLEQYRALCLLALGREEEAIAAIERLVRAEPAYLPSASETSPRIQSIFAAVRTRLVPDVAKKTYVEAKAAYEEKKYDAARASFERTLTLINSMPDPQKADLADLKLLATEFLDLSGKAPGASPAAPPPSTEPLVPAVYVAPVPVREVLPAWTPPDAAARRTEYTGLLRLQIAADGRVESAGIVKSSHPTYDVLVLRAARGWEYKPATRGGVRVAAQRDIQITLTPR